MEGERRASVGGPRTSIEIVSKPCEHCLAEQKGVLNGRCCQCVKKCNTCIIGMAALVSFVAGIVILSFSTPHAIENGSNANYLSMTADIFANVGGAILISGGAWKIGKLFCALRAENQKYPQIQSGV